MDYHYFLSERLAVGASLGWNTLYKHLDYATGHFTMNGVKVTISGYHFRYLNVVPLMASVRYFYGWRCCPATICQYRYRNQLG